MAKRAVCVGIDEYAERTIPRLSGCASDARGFAAALSRQFGFAEPDVKLLLNDRATREAILRSIDWMLMTAGQGDVLVLYMACYGTVMPDPRAPGELDEVFVAHDHSYQFTQLRDDEIAEKLRRVPPGVTFACILDTGRLGKMLPPAGMVMFGAPLETEGRFLAPPADLPALSSLRTRPLPFAPRLRARRSDDPPGVVVFACGEGEVARESGGGGVFTTAFLEVLGGGASTPWAEAVRQAGERLRSRGEAQTPSCIVADPLRGAPVLGGAGGGAAPAASATSYPGMPTGYGGQPAAPPSYGAPAAPSYGAPVAVATPPGGGGMGLMAAGAAGLAALGATALGTGGPPASMPGVMPYAGAPIMGVSSPVDLVLGEFSPTDTTVRVCNALFSVVPFAPKNVLYRSLDEATQILYPQADAAMKQRIAALASGEGATAALKALSTVDTASTGIALFSGLKGALGLLRGQGMNALETDTQQGVDAVLKLLAMSYSVYKLYPGPIPGRVQLFHMTPAGQQLSIFYGAIDVALPFADNAIAGAGNLVGSLVNRFGGDASSKLGSIAGGEAVGEAQGVLGSLLAPVEGIVQRVTPYAKQAASAVSQHLPMALNVADKAAGVVATGLDALPIYKYLGARVVAEACVLIASRGM